MARSYRKHLWHRLNDSYYKRLQHTRNRMLARVGIYLSSRQYKYTVNPYDICDYAPNMVRTHSLGKVLQLDNPRDRLLYRWIRNKEASLAQSG